MKSIDVLDGYRHLMEKCSKDLFNLDYTLPLIEEFLTRYPQFSHALRLRALARNFEMHSAPSPRKAELLPLVRKDLETAIEADSDNILAYIDLAEILGPCGDIAGAVKQYEAALDRLRRGIFVENLAEELQAAEAGLAELAPATAAAKLSDRF